MLPNYTKLIVVNVVLTVLLGSNFVVGYLHTIFMW